MTAQGDFNQAVQAAQAARLSDVDVSVMLAELGEALGIDLALTDDGRCTVFDTNGREIALLFQAGFPGVTLTAPVIEEETIPREMLITLLRTNAEWQATAGGTFSMPEPSGTVLFSRHVMMFERDTLALVNAINAFGAQVEAWESDIYFHLDAVDPAELSEDSPAPQIPFQITHA